MKQNWYIGNSLGEHKRIYFDVSHCEKFVTIVERIPELSWLEDLDPEISETWKKTPQYYKTSAIFDFNLKKVNPYGLHIWYDNNVDIIIADPRSKKDKKAISIIFDIADALNANVYEGSVRRLREKFMQG